MNHLTPASPATTFNPAPSAVGERMGREGTFPAAFWLALAFLPSLAVPSTAATLVNGGFEEPTTSDGPPFVGFWEVFTSGAGVTAGHSAELPRSGSQSLLLEILGVDNAFAGAFQDIPELVAGQTGTFSGWHRMNSPVLDLGVEIRIEWRDSVNNVEISRTPNLVPALALGGDYESFTWGGTVPAGADTARVVYAIQTFGSEPANAGRVHVDDVSFIVPEPTALSLLAIGALGALVRRRR